MKIAEIKNIPAAPGVYLMKNLRKNIIYVGKAKNLKKRVGSYFNRQHEDAKTAVLVKKITDIEYIVTPSEVEALILESNLIKKHKPRYNILYKDDKSYPFLKIATSEDFPRIQVIRNPNFKRGAKNDTLYGPFPNSKNLRSNIRFLNKLFKLRTCTNSKMNNRTRPCINHDIGLCLAPCMKNVSSERYSKLVEQVFLFFKGKNKKLSKILDEQMKTASEKQEYEQAAEIRDRITELEKLTEKQIITDSSDKDMDVISYYHNEGRCIVYILFIRQGMMLGGSPHLLNIEVETHLGQHNIASILETFMNQFYNNKYVPQKIAVHSAPENLALLQETFSEISSKKVTIFVPQKGKNADLVKLAYDNAKTSFDQKVEKIVSTSKSLLELKQKLNLPTIPSIIECFDISNFGGKNPVASKVVCREGEMDKKSYRHYKIKTDFKGEQNDFAMLAEVIGRTYSKNEEDPDLILIDGGKGQINSVAAILSELGKKYPCAGIAKARVDSDFKNEELVKSIDRIYLPGRKNPVQFKENNPALVMLTRIRDEAHRFAITFNRKLMRKDLNND